MTNLRRLSGRRRARLEAGRFVVDGPTLVAEALEAGVDVVEVYAEPAAPDDVLELARSAGVPVRAVADGVLAKVTSPVTAQPVAALAALPTPPGDEVLRGLVLVLVGVADPGNAGTLLRVAEAAGASAVVSCADAVDLWNPKAVRASAGSLFRVPVLVEGSAPEALHRLRGAGMTTLATALDASVGLDDVDLRGDVAVLLGNEAHGLPADVVAAADLAVRIPMAGRVESLNVAMTGTVVAFEAARQRRTSP
ncbi:MAG: TrmH family RNA methyltransferase [Acidimicrobiia bacterium]